MAALTTPERAPLAAQNRPPHMYGCVDGSGARNHGRTSGSLLFRLSGGRGCRAPLRVKRIQPAAELVVRFCALAPIEVADR